MVAENFAVELANIIRDGRSVEQIKRGEFCSLLSLQRDIGNCIEHAKPPNMRWALRAMIHRLSLPAKTMNRAFNLIDSIFPQQFESRKVHHRYTILIHRRVQRTAWR